MSQSAPRSPDHPVDPLFVDRWSTRAFTGEPIPDEVLFTAFEAVRWAPSGGNTQSWRLLYVKRDTPDWDRLFKTLAERNQIWAARAGALVLFLSNRFRTRPGGDPEPLRSHSFDAGAAWSNFAHQIVRSGWATRAIGGFNRDAARAEFAVPETYELEAVIAVGKPASPSVLPDDFAALDKPNSRLPVSQIVSEGAFAFS